MAPRLRDMHSYRRAQESITAAMGFAVTEAIKKLLSEKHLYQTVEVDLKYISEAKAQVQREMEREWRASGSLSLESPAEFVKDASANLEIEVWVPAPITATPYRVLADSIPISFKLPTINTFCDKCKDRWPFNPVADGSYLVQEIARNESFYLGYECQQCKGQPIRFLVRREGLKLRLAGRYPLEVLPTPKVLPKTVSKYYSDAMVAHHAGQTLAGLFLLRVFIEQFWRSIPEVQAVVAATPKATGDEQGSAYQKTLPDEFKARFPSLTDIYDKLSAAIHLADENATLFDESSAKIDEHFDAKRLYKIT